jgi:hypothetical protein
VHQVVFPVSVFRVASPSPRPDHDKPEDHHNGHEEMETVDHDAPTFLVQRVHARITPFLRVFEVEV